MDAFTSFVSLAGKNAVITGGGRGIGRAYARAFAAAGATAIIAECDLASAQSVADEITASGGRALAIVTDVAEPASIGALSAQIESELGGADILVNNAAFFADIDMRPFYEIPDEEWEYAMRVNITGCYRCAKALTPQMRAKGWGRIINISSSVVEMGRANYMHYVTSKSALVGMTRAMARELGEFGITVNAVMPGLVKTEVPRKTSNDETMEQIAEQQCVKRVGATEDIAAMVVFLATDAASFVSGQTILVDGGLYFR
jgi:NAD(P)-dependent dehydrogenase (short-subunit alcohol dehydrogenase family)